MPTLQFSGKDIIWNHHLAVPECTLVPVKELSFQEYKSDNLLIEGDNLPALKALLPHYAKKVKCIYIDPPYNTGKGEWLYSDTVNSSLIQRWLHQTVGEQQLNRHDKWLCMMVPRLQLLKELLSPEGVIFISLDNNEAFHFKLLADEIFGEDNFLGIVVLQTATDNNPTQIATEHEYIFGYAANKSQQKPWQAPSEAADRIQEKYLELKVELGSDVASIQTKLRAWVRGHKQELPRTAHYNYVDEKGVFYPGNPSNTKPGGYHYQILHPITKKVCAQPVYGYRWPATTFWQAAERGNVLWGEDETIIPKIKKRLETVTSSLRSILYEDGRSATAELDRLFGKGFFKNAKSPTVLKRLFEFTTSGNDIILDCFAGSGSTGQAVLELNKQDGGNRQFILVQMPENSDAQPNKNICRDKTRLRLQKVIEAYGLDSGFSYAQLGAPI